MTWTTEWLSLYTEFFCLSFHFLYQQARITSGVRKMYSVNGNPSACYKWAKVLEMFCCFEGLPLFKFTLRNHLVFLYIFIWKTYKSAKVFFCHPEPNSLFNNVFRSFPNIQQFLNIIQTLKTTSVVLRSRFCGILFQGLEPTGIGIS
jgi:hypothetical protein